MSESRVKKSFQNAKVNVFFYLITLFLSFFSRKIFLERLGADFIGLTGTLQNLLGFLNLADLGIGASMGYILYKPLFEKNQEKLREIISVLGYLYRYVGLFILIAGGILALFLPLIFEDTSIGIGVVYFAYFSFLVSSLIGYFINYRQFLLGADQRNYVVTAYSQTANLVKTLLQMALVCYVGSYYLWIAVELAFGILYSVILNWKINQVYPWLKCSVALGKEKYPENKIIMQKSRQLFVHVLAGTGRTQLLPFLIYAFTSLKLVAYYGNYMLLITKLSQLVNNFLGSTGAGVGNLIAEGDRKRILQVFWELNSLRFVIAGFFAFALYHLIDPFITVWLGTEYDDREGKKNEGFVIGSNSQIKLLKDPGSYPTFEVRNIVGNGKIWTGSGTTAKELVPSTASSSEQLNENRCSCGIRITYGNFDYFSAGDILGVEKAPEWFDIETPVAKLLGETDVVVANHHAYSDAMCDTYISQVKPQVYVIPVWDYYHPQPATLSRMLSQTLYPGERSVFAAGMVDSNRSRLGEDGLKIKPAGHVVTRVYPGGEKFQIFVLNDRNEAYEILYKTGEIKSNN